jgi:hypothetical protein
MKLRDICGFSDIKAAADLRAKDKPLADKMAVEWDKQAKAAIKAAKEAGTDDEETCFYEIVNNKLTPKENPWS